MVYRKATYEEYIKASSFAKIRYKFGVYIQVVALILLCFLIYYTVTNIEEMKANPMDYAEEKLGVMCSYPYNYGGDVPLTDIDYGSIRNITNISEGR